MRVAFINSVVGFGSTGRICVDLASIPDIESRIYYGRKENHTDMDAFRMTTLFGNIQHAIQTFLFDKHGFCNGKETERMVENLIQFNPDIIHLHNLHGYYLNIDVLFAALKNLGKPVVWTLHDCWPVTGHCAYYDKVHCDQWKIKCESCRALSQYPPTWNQFNFKKNFFRKKSVFNRLDKNQMVLVTPSTWLKNEMMQSFLNQYTIRVIPNGIDLNVFKRTESSFREKNHLEEKFVILGCASYWSAEKGLDDLKALSYLLSDQQHLIVVGIKDNQQNGFNKEKTTFVKRTNSIQELCELYSCADVFVNPTFQDNFPTVNLEAQACGTPVVTYNTGGSGESITEKTGVILDEKTPESILKSINDLSKYPLSSQDCMQNSIVYSKENMLNNYLNLYMECVNGLL